MGEKKFYRIVESEYLSLKVPERRGSSAFTIKDYQHYSQKSRIHYGTMTDVAKHAEKDLWIENYGEFVDAVSKHKIKSDDFFVWVKWFGLGKSIVKEWRWEGVDVVPEDKFVMYSRKSTVEEVSPSISTLKEELAVSEYLDWLWDNGIELSEKAVVSL